MRDPRTGVTRSRARQGGAPAERHRREDRSHSWRHVGSLRDRHADGHAHARLGRRSCRGQDVLEGRGPTGSVLQIGLSSLFRNVGHSTSVGPRLHLDRPLRSSPGRDGLGESRSRALGLGGCCHRLADPHHRCLALARGDRRRRGRLRQRRQRGGADDCLLADAQAELLRPDHCRPHRDICDSKPAGRQRAPDEPGARRPYGPPMPACRWRRNARCRTPTTSRWRGRRSRS